VRVAAIVAALVLTGLGAFIFLAGRQAPGDTAAPAASTTTPTPPAAKPRVATKPTPAVSKPVLRPDLPAPVAAALRNRQVAVVAVYVPGAAVDSIVRREAKAGAKLAAAAYVPVSASSGSALEKIVAKTGVLPTPAVVIFERPGNVAMVLSVVDRQTVAAAVRQAKSSK
jgi:hypothetical protein